MNICTLLEVTVLYIRYKFLQEAATHFLSNNKYENISDKNTE